TSWCNLWSDLGKHTARRFRRGRGQVSNSVDQHRRSNLRSCQSAKVETARFVRNTLHDARNFLSESLLARRNRASHARPRGSDVHSWQVSEWIDPGNISGRDDTCAIV